MTAQAALPPRVLLLRGFELRVAGRPVPVKTVAQRLAAFLALQDRALSRTYVSGALWPDTPTNRANANLRSALWRLQGSCSRLIDVSMQHLRLAPEVTVDFHSAVGVAHRLVAPLPPSPEDLEVSARMELSSDLLPDWYDDWVLMERERFRQLRLHALEALARRLASAERYAEAIDAGLAAIRAEPLRESAHRTLICVYLAEGNKAEAVHQYERCRRFLRKELGIEPSPEIRRLVAGNATPPPLAR